MHIATFPLHLLRYSSSRRALISSHGREEVGGGGVRHVEDARLRGAPESRAAVVKLHLEPKDEANEA